MRARPIASSDRPTRVTQPVAPLPRPQPTPPEASFAKSAVSASAPRLAHGQRPTPTTVELRRASPTSEGLSLDELASFAELLDTADEAPIVTLSAVARFWRDFGVNPLAMARRILVDRPARGGEPIEGGRRADSSTISDLQAELRGALASFAATCPDGVTDTALERLQSRVKSIAARYGVPITFGLGAPTVSWGDVPAIEVSHRGGGAAAHEMVHVAQYLIGAVAALATAASARIYQARGRQPRSTAEVKAAMTALTPKECKLAFEAIVTPMETQGYVTIEQGAFHATGFMGRRARDTANYVAGLNDNIEAFAAAYSTATVPALDTASDARAYGTIGHVARTHGETSLLFFGGAAAYAQVVAAAAATGPIAALVALIPAGYVLYRATTG